MRNNVSARQRYRVYPLTHSQQHSLQCVILYGQSGRADGPSVWLRKTPSPHFQFSTLMNHNQIIHKLPPRFQTNNMAQKRVWLRVRVWLVRRQHVDELARSGIWSTRPWKLYYKMRPRCCQPLHWAVFMSFCFLVSGILWLGLLRLHIGSPGKYVDSKTFHTWATFKWHSRDTDKDIYTQKHAHYFSNSTLSSNLGLSCNLPLNVSFKNTTIKWKKQTMHFSHLHSHL